MEDVGRWEKGFRAYELKVFFWHCVELSEFKIQGFWCLRGFRVSGVDAYAFMKYTLPRMYCRTPGGRYCPLLGFLFYPFHLYYSVIIDDES